MEVERYDTAEMLDEPEVVIEFLRRAWASGDASKISAAVGAVARSEGMTKIARATGLSREGLYKSLSEDGNPSLATIIKVLDACGLVLVPSEKSRRLETA